VIWALDGDFTNARGTTRVRSALGTVVSETEPPNTF
jgi:hypothetical protein